MLNVVMLSVVVLISEPNRGIVEHLYPHLWMLTEPYSLHFIVLLRKRLARND
jgi:hypothetical protein